MRAKDTRSRVLRGLSDEIETMKSMPNRAMTEAEAGGSFGQEGEPSKVSHAYGYTPTNLACFGSRGACSADTPVTIEPPRLGIDTHGFKFQVGDSVHVSSFPGGHYVGRVEKCVPGAELSDPYGENLYHVSGLMKLQRERVLSRAGASSYSDIPKSATPATETPCRCGVVPLPDEAYPFFNPHELHRATPEKERPE